MSRAATLIAMLVLLGASLPAQRPGVWRSPSGVTLKLLVSDSTVGPEMAMGELTFPPNLDSGEHAHGAIEVLYVLEGALTHTVDGVVQHLGPGMAGYVRPGGRIRHQTGPSGAKVLVVWVPGEEAERITARWAREP